MSLVLLLAPLVLSIVQMKKFRKNLECRNVIVLCLGTFPRTPSNACVFRSSACVEL